MTTFALQVCTGCESRFLAAARRAAGDRAVLIWPRRSLRIRRGGRWLPSLAPVFPGYLFVTASAIDSGLFTDLRRIPGFLRFLPSNSAIAPLSLKDRELLSHLTGFGEIVTTSTVTFDANGRIRVCAGPLKGLEGSIVRVDRRKGRARVRLEMYEDSFEIDFGFEALEKASAAGPPD
jgi:transcriptional antiterminator NusG